ncbi:MAG: benzoate-CoA ligase family protein [Arenicellales bacterium]
MSEQGTAARLAADIGFSLPERYNASDLIYDHLGSRGESPAVICDSGTWSYRDLADEASRAGNALLALGCRPGDRVLLCLDDEPACPATIMGALRAGLVAVLVNTLSPPDLIRFFLEDSEARVAVVSPAFASLFTDETLRGTACRGVLLTGPEGGDHEGWGTVREASPELERAPTTPDDMAFWMYSSGSTGKPKAVVHRHADPAYTAASYARHILHIREDDVCFSIPKIFFAYGFGNSITFPMSVGACSVLMTGRPEPAAVFEQIARHRPTILFALPTLYTALARSEVVAGADLGSVRLCISAAEILSEDVAKAWWDRFGHDIVEGLGSTEMLHIYLSNDDRMRKAGSAGRVVPGYAVKLTDVTGEKEVGPGEEGIMSVCGPSAAQQYWGRPDKTAETMRGEWTYTGDRFVRDSDGFYFFKGRADDLVKVSGQWVYPLEVELALAEHPKVHECCVQALPLPDQRMTLHAWVVPAVGMEPGEALVKELQDYVKSALLPYKYPRRVEFLESLPKTGTGKIDRQALKNRAAGDAA